MLSINGLSAAPRARGWLTNSRGPRILHIFDSACNLIDERGEVFSIVTQQIGNGPFNLVVEDRIFFSEHLNPRSPITICADQLVLGELTIYTGNAVAWPPRPDWERLHAMRENILDQLTKLPITSYQVCSLPVRGLRDAPFAGNTQGCMTPKRLQSQISNLSPALATADIPTALAITSQLSGLGAGLTPAGDDFILGAVLAVWIIHPSKIACVMAKEVTNTAAPLTTSLSAAWLRSAGKGEAGISWHEFFDSLISVNPVRIQEAMDNILAIGETSGADALGGFLGTLMCWAELASSRIH